MPRRPHPAAIAIALLFLLAPTSTASAGAEGAPTSPPRYRPPVVAPVSDPFRAPAGPYGAGNRGLEYATRPGQAVVAIGAGTVVFAGTIAHRRYVTVLHPDGLRSSYSYLASIAVAVGDAVVGGQSVGTAGERLHLGVRRGDRYLDPASLFRRGRPRLVPTRGSSAGGSRR